jgi:steroid 5-alpha reductase family enzyme
MERILDLMRLRRILGSLVLHGMSFTAYSSSTYSSNLRIRVLTYRLGQATWITLVSLPAILVNTIPRAAHPALGLRDLIGVGIWAGGLGLEILADSRMSPCPTAS